MKNIVLIIGNEHQANAIGFIREFETKGGEINSILCLKPKKSLKNLIKIPFRFLKVLNPSIVNRASKSVVAKILKKEEFETIKAGWNNTGENSWDVLKETMDIHKYAQERQIPFHYSSFLSDEVINSLTKQSPTIFVLYAGGILSRKLLSNKRAEFINAHMGEMPRYRGMNVLEWAVLENQPLKVAVMIMNEKIDGGDVIWHRDIQLSGEQTIKELRTTGYINCYKAMAEGIIEYINNDQLRKPQSKGGKYYYRMHSKVKLLAEKKLQKLTATD